MALETATYITDLVATNPLGSDQKSTLDDHARLTKSVLKNSFPNISGAVTATHTQLNTVPDLAPKNSPAFTGTPTAPTAAAGTSTTQLATTEFVAGTAFSSALPAQTGNAGKYITTNGTTASWASLVVAGTGGQTTTGSLTLTSSSAAAITVTPSTPGLYVTLPDATTCSKADNLFAVYNAGDYDYGVKDSTGTQLGWIRARTGAMIGLSDSSTAAGVWAYYGLEKTGITASYVNSTLTNMGSTIVRVVLDADRDCFLFGGTSCYAIVYNKTTQTWGSATLVRSGMALAGGFAGVKSATDQVLTITNTSTELWAATLTISGTSITVNTAVMASLAGSIASGAVGQLIAVGSSFVVSYGRATTVSGIRAITVSGTTPTIGAESAITTAVSQSATLFASGSVVRTICQGSGGTSVLCTPYTVSGATLTLGTQATAPATNATNRSFLNGNGNIVCHYLNTTHYATIFKLTGTTEAASSVSLGTVPGTFQTTTDYLPISSSKTCFGWVDASATSAYYRILTDSAGTASVGTQLTVSTDGTGQRVGAGTLIGTTAQFIIYASQSVSVHRIDCSGVNAAISSIASTQYASNITFYPTARNAYGERSWQMVHAGTNSRILVGTTSAFDMVCGSVGVKTAQAIPQIGYPSNGGVSGSSDSETYLAFAFANGTTGFYINRVEAAA